MKILLLNSCLEPGRDGVGDYTRQLAAGCTAAGHSCSLLAWADPFTPSGAPCRQLQTSEGHTFATLRLPPTASWQERLAAAEAFVAAEKPDWLSWQLVPYGFHPKGIFPAAALPLASLGGDRPRHVFMHELWIGVSRGEPWKNHLYRLVQRPALLRFLRRLAPRVLATSIPAYRTLLAREGLVAEILPLWGTLPLSAPPEKTAPSGEWCGGVFGTIHSQFDPRPCLDRLHRETQRAGRRLRIIAFGRLGAHGDSLFQELQNTYAGRIAIERRGELPPSEVSRLMDTLDFGIGTHPWALIGKSGVVATMLDHGLPVIVPRDDWALRGLPTPPPEIDPLVRRLADLPDGGLTDWLAARRPPVSRLPALTRQFLASLQR